MGACSKMDLVLGSAAMRRSDRRVDVRPNAASATAPQAAGVASPARTTTMTTERDVLSRYRGRLHLAAGVDPAHGASAERGSQRAAYGR
jgi:hypothetical protein